jgi:hypothetical protein
MVYTIRGFYYILYEKRRKFAVAPTLGTEGGSTKVRKKAGNNTTLYLNFANALWVTFHTFVPY